MVSSESEDELSVAKPPQELEFKASLGKVLQNLQRALSKLTGKPLQAQRSVPPELLMIEVKNTAGLIAQEVDLLSAKDQAQKKKIASLEEAAASMAQKLELASRQLSQAEAREAECHAHVEALELQLERVEDPAKQSTEELTAYFESLLRSESAEKHVYRALFGKLKQAFRGELGEDLDRLVRVMLDLETIKHESLGLQHACKSSLPEDSVSEDWRQLVDGVSEGLRAVGRREQELLELQADLEAKVDSQLEAQIVHADLQRKTRGGSLLLSQPWIGDRAADSASRLQPRSSGAEQGPQQGGTLLASGTQVFGHSEWAGEPPSRTDFTSVKYRLQQIKNKLV